MPNFKKLLPLEVKTTVVERTFLHSRTTIITDGVSTYGQEPTLFAKFLCAHRGRHSFFHFFVNVLLYHL